MENRFEYIKGRKKEGDRIIKFNGVAVKFEDVAKMCIFFMNNEDILYPPEQGFKGAEMFKDYIKDVLETREIPTNSKYKIKKNKLTKISDKGMITDLRYANT
tara:strand:+ start:195 stop:500 length:306 start_codon:yes stop_codon:yes gene_type:complete